MFALSCRQQKRLLKFIVAVAWAYSFGWNRRNRVVNYVVLYCAWWLFLCCRGYAISGCYTLPGHWNVCSRCLRLCVLHKWMHYKRLRTRIAVIRKLLGISLSLLIIQEYNLVSRNDILSNKIVLLWDFIGRFFRLNHGTHFHLHLLEVAHELVLATLLYLTHLIAYLLLQWSVTLRLYCFKLAIDHDKGCIRVSALH